jgi:hypothetical protein
MDLLNIVMYLIILGVFGIVLYVERNDNECPGPFSPRSECVEGSGMPLRGSKPKPGDDCETLLTKINIASGAEYRSIKWRRAFTQSVIVMFLAWVLVITPGMLPQWFAFYSSVVTAFAVLYFCLNYYSYHLFKTAEDFITQATSMLAENCIIKTK